VENIPEDYLEERKKEILEDFLKMKELTDNSSFEKKKFKNLVTNIDKLRNKLNELNPSESSWLGISEIIEDEQDNPLKWLVTDGNKEELKNLEDYLCNLKSRAERASEFFKDNKGGRPKDLALQHFIKRMAWLWKEATGKKPSKTYPTDPNYKYDFLDWVYVSLENAGHPPWSKQSLSGHIKRALS
jgi:DNA repair exonuclease SbcCD ATPase subunit